MNLNLPPLPEPHGWRYELWGLPECHWEYEWLDTFDTYAPVAEKIRNVKPLYTAEQVEAIRREAVEVCARVCEAQREQWIRKNLLGYVAVLDDAAAAIRALLNPNPPSAEVKE